MATCNTSTLLESAKCFSCLSKKELQAIIAQLLCNISVDGVPVDPDAGILKNVQIPFTLISGTTDSIPYDVGLQQIGWKLVAWNWFITSTPAVWGTVPAALAMYFYYDIETSITLTDQLEAHTGELDAGISGTGGNSGGIVQPIYFQHAQQPSFVVEWDAAPAVGETVAGYVRLLLKQESTT